MMDDEAGEATVPRLAQVVGTIHVRSVMSWTFHKGSGNSGGMCRIRVSPILIHRMIVRDV